MTNSTITANAACKSGGCAGNGGGIDNNVGTTTLINDTISENTVCSAGSCSGGSSVNNDLASNTHTTLSNTIRANNGGISSSPDCHGTIGDGKPNGSTTVGNNIIGNSTGCRITSLTHNDQIGTSNSSIDPQLGPLQANGGPTPTMQLLTGSTAIHPGDLSPCTGTAVGDVDQRGEPRPASGSLTGCDIGAYDTLGTVTVYVSPTGNDANTCTLATAPCRHSRVGLATVASGGTVSLAGGTYCEQIVVVQPVTVQGNGSAGNPAIIDGGAPLVSDTGSANTNPCHAGRAQEQPGHSAAIVGDGNGTAVTVTLRGLTLQHGDAANNPSGINTIPGLGGGILVEFGASLTLSDDWVRWNSGCNGNIGCSAFVGASGALCAGSSVGDQDQRGDPRHSSARGTCTIGAYDTGQYVRLAVTLNPPSTTVSPGQQFTLTVTATNETDGTPATGYRSTIAFASTDAGLIIPSYTFTAADGGSHSFNAAPCRRSRGTQMAATRCGRRTERPRGSPCRHGRARGSSAAAGVDHAEPTVRCGFWVLTSMGRRCRANPSWVSRCGSVQGSIVRL